MVSSMVPCSGGDPQVSGRNNPAMEICQDGQCSGGDPCLPTQGAVVAT
eukprot:CAMPEP_0196664022 /NCGR_PEP_ID=MMETSP1086-20130531/55219_1 /TAXON_ID=77921 /ORGANISM="Cyanoptyche  gloeocystis , Strain SAG4.97" /LENGTH=47 /DNA_ID= /DNA_START= /DNA_END= /DNA_ORIENTATION=